MHPYNVPLPTKEISEFCQRWGVVAFSLFGSILREDFHADRDVDVLVTFAPGAQVSVFDMVTMQGALATLFGRTVDLVEKAALHNPYRRREILHTAQRIYAA